MSDAHSESEDDDRLLLTEALAVTWWEGSEATGRLLGSPALKLASTSDADSARLYMATRDTVPCQVAPPCISASVSEANISCESGVHDDTYPRVVVLPPAHEPSM